MPENVPGHRNLCLESKLRTTTVSNCLYPEKGYVRIMESLLRANHLKNNGTLEEFRKLVKWLKEQEASRAEMACG